MLIFLLICCDRPRGKSPEGGLQCPHNFFMRPLT